MVEVFSTDVQEATEAEMLRFLLLERFPSCSFHFDLEDCDKILRVEGENLCIAGIVTLLENSGFLCSVLPD